MCSGILETPSTGLPVILIATFLHLSHNFTTSSFLKITYKRQMKTFMKDVMASTHAFLRQHLFRCHMVPGTTQRAGDTGWPRWRPRSPGASILKDSDRNQHTDHHSDEKSSLLRGLRVASGRVAGQAGHWDLVAGGQRPTLPELGQAGDRLPSDSE